MRLFISDTIFFIEKSKKKLFVTCLEMCVRTPKCTILVHLIGNDPQHKSAESRVEHKKLKKNSGTLWPFSQVFGLQP